MNETPKRARTELEVVVSGNEKDKSAPAWIGEGEEVPEKDREVTFEEIVMSVALDAETD